jgi:hypothetical protein
VSRLLSEYHGRGAYRHVPIDGDLDYDLLTSTIVLLAGSQLVVLESKKVSRWLIEELEWKLIVP